MILKQGHSTKNCYQQIADQHLNPPCMVLKIIFKGRMCMVISGLQINGRVADSLLSTDTIQRH